MKFLSCFQDPYAANSEPAESCLLPNGKKQGCAFCNVTRDNGFNVVWEDEELIAFQDRTPRAAVHLLVIPRAHTADSVRNLTPAHLPLIERMSARGNQLAISLSDQPDPVLKSGFHIPPFSSVPHLHLHVFVMPHTFVGRLKYPIANSSPADRGDPVKPDGSHLRERGRGDGGGREEEGRGKGWSWFVTAEQTMGILARGGTVGLGRR